VISDKMIRALAGALHANPAGGLIHTRAGWRHPVSAGSYHHAATVEALVSRGYLWAYGGGQGTARRVSITARGEEALMTVLDATRSARAAR
jgi:hypothetical protein